MGQLALTMGIAAYCCSLIMYGGITELSLLREEIAERRLISYRPMSHRVRHNAHATGGQRAASVMFVLVSFAR